MGNLPWQLNGSEWQLAVRNQETIELTNAQMVWQHTFQPVDLGFEVHHQLTFGTEELIRDFVVKRVKHPIGGGQSTSRVRCCRKNGVRVGWTSLSTGNELMGMADAQSSRATWIIASAEG